LAVVAGRAGPCLRLGAGASRESASAPDTDALDLATDWRSPLNVITLGLAFCWPKPKMVGVMTGRESGSPIARGLDLGRSVSTARGWTWAPQSADLHAPAAGPFLATEAAGPDAGGRSQVQESGSFPRCAGRSRRSLRHDRGRVVTMGRVASARARRGQTDKEKTSV